MRHTDNTIIEQYSHLPIEMGGRPAFGGRAILEKLEMFSMVNNGGFGLSVATGWAARSVLNALCSCIDTLKVSDPSLILKNIYDLPLLLSYNFVYIWEVEQPWKKWNLDPYTISEYGNILEGEHPSNAYNPYHNDITCKVWKAFFIHTSNEQIYKILQESISFWDKWIKRHPDFNTFQQSIKELSLALEKLGLEKEQANALALLERWWVECEYNSFSVSTNFVLEQTSKNQKKWANMCSLVANTSLENIESLFNPTSILENLTMYILAQGDKNQKFNKINSNYPPKDIDNLSKFRTPLWREALNHWRDYNQLPWSEKENNNKNLELVDKWKHLNGQFNTVARALDKDAKILVIGKNGMGKTTFCQDVVNYLGKNAILVDCNGIDLNSIENVLNEKIWIAKIQTNSIIILDDAQSIISSVKTSNWIEHVNIPVLVNIAKTEDGDKFLNKFNKIIWIDEMEMEYRFDLAKSNFKDEKLALRVARALKTPRDIIQAYEWCKISNSWNWETVKSHFDANRRVISNGNMQNYTFKFEENLKDQKIPPFVVNKSLEDLENRLCIAFENPQVFEQMGATPPKGAVLIGPPGTGKTLFAKHIAQKLNAPLIAPDVSKLFSKPELIKELFELARNNAPCIILMDEAEKLICKGFDNELPNALTSLLSEIDGISSLEGVMVIATTNNPRIYEAFTRSGRLSEVRHILPPLNDQRKNIWKAYLDNITFKNNIDKNEASDILAKATQGFTGADIAETIRRGVGEAISNGRVELELNDLIISCDNVRWSEANGRDPIDLKEREKVAYHEAGHAMFAWRWGLDVLRITVKSRQNSLGMVQWNIPERTYSQSKSALFGKLQMILGGIISESAIYGEYEGGGSSDLEYARIILSNGFTRSGLSHRGPVSAPMEISLWPDQLRMDLEFEMKFWSDYALEEGMQWLDDNRDILDKLAQELLQKGDMSGPELDVYEKLIRENENLPSPPVYTPQYINQSVNTIYKENKELTLANKNPTLHYKKDNK